MSTLRLVFVCSGNICRSPIAAAFARQKAADRDVSAVVLSCGTLGIVGHPAAELGRVAMAEVGVDIADHYSQGVQAAMLNLADHVFVMAPKHEEFLRRTVPSATSRLVRMWEFAPEPMDQIDDPVGQDLDAFRHCRDLLDRCLDNWFDARG